ncbi:MAG: endonuclease/exonuclease/phosphatase family protein [Neisseriaceae bacterium]
MQNQLLTITSYNIHKGMSAFNRRVQVNCLAQALKQLDSSILFLQEVQGLNLKKIKKIREFPKEPQDEIIARFLDYYNSYGKNAIFKTRHHGNAILSAMPIVTKKNINLSTNTLERRGMLHCQIQPPGWPRPVECFCAHLNLTQQERKKQYMAILNYFKQFVDPESPVILAGDFNDWNRKSHFSLEEINLAEAFLTYQGFSPKTFPARLPLLSLDRIFVRHLKVVDAFIHTQGPWSKLSDHLPITAKLLPI